MCISEYAGLNQNCFRGLSKVGGHFYTVINFQIPREIASKILLQESQQLLFPS
jgi:hypothetical protein